MIEIYSRKDMQCTLLKMKTTKLCELLVDKKKPLQFAVFVKAGRLSAFANQSQGLTYPILRKR